jgi:hypothetical protein
MLKKTEDKAQLRVTIHLKMKVELISGRPVKLLLALASTVLLGFGSRRDHIFFLLKTCTCFEMGALLQRDEEHDCYWSLPFYWG